MPSSRTRLRPWLEQKIESKSIPGLTWVDKGNKMFAIPWKHAARHGWEMDTDARIFMQWAVHTGKFKPGVTEPDPKTWKANFRSALNSLPDIKQVKDKSINKGSQAIRVYRMLEEVPKKKDKKPKTTHKRKIKNAEWDTNPEQDCKDQLNHSGAQSTDTSNESTQETTVDSTGGLGLSVHHFGDEGEAVECSTTVEVIADSTNEFYGLFQVSPIHTTDFEEDEAAIIEMAQALEVEQLQWQQTNANAPEMDMKYCKELKGLSGNMEDSSNCENSETQIILFSAQLPLCSST